MFVASARALTVAVAVLATQQKIACGLIKAAGRQQKSSAATPRPLRNSSFLGVSLLDSGLSYRETDCSNPSGVSCQCSDPTFPCRKSWDSQCFCFTHTNKVWCEADGGHWCQRPAACVPNCDVCQDDKKCSTCAAGYMQVHGMCTIMPPTEEQTWVKAHNLLRCVHGSPPLVWSQAVADSAKAWAEHLDQAGGLQHSDNLETGENLAWGSGSPQATSSGWYSEVDCCSALPGCEDGSGSCSSRQFTTMVWDGVTELGCATAGGHRVCRYRHGGNASCGASNTVGCHFTQVRSRMKDLGACIYAYDTPAAQPAAELARPPPAEPAAELGVAAEACASPASFSRRECETCFLHRHCGSGYSCHNRFKRCVSDAGDSVCVTPDAGCPDTCVAAVCSSGGCDCECGLVGELLHEAGGRGQHRRHAKHRGHKTFYAWLEWANLADANSTSPQIPCENA